MRNFYKSIKAIKKLPNNKAIFKFIPEYGLVFSINGDDGITARGFACLPKLKKHKNFIRKICQNML